VSQPIEQGRRKPITAEQVGSRLNAALAHGRKLQVTGGWAEAKEYLDGISGVIEAAQIGILNERGLVNRMRGDYTAADRDFLIARAIAHSRGDFEGEITAIGGQIDLARTGDRDPNYKRGKDLEFAQALKNEAINVLFRISDEWNLAKVNTFIQLGLLDHELGDKEQALEEYALAEQGCRTLLKKKPRSAGLQNRLMRVLTIKGVTQTDLGQFEDAAASQKHSEAIQSFMMLEE